jgi:acyl-CoA dehydrogenase
MSAIDSGSAQVKRAAGSWLTDGDRDPVPPFTAEHEQFRRSTRRWVREHLAPHADEWEAAKHFPDEVFRRCGAAGFFGLKFDPEWGGEGADVVADAVVVEELQWCGSGGVAAGIGTQMAIALPPIHRFGTDEQKERFLRPGIRGERIGSLAISEPDAGSDVAGLRTRARRVDGGWLVSGSKMYITNGVRADFLVMAVRTGPAQEAARHRGISLLIVEPALGPGFSASALDKMGCGASDTAVIGLDDVFVPDANLLGAEGAGFRMIMSGFVWERIHMSLVALGNMSSWFGRTCDFVRTRQAFGKPLSGNQVVAHELAEIATTIHSCRTVTYDALRRYAEGADCRREAAMAKLVTQRAACLALDQMLQLHGGAGYISETGIERTYRDSRLGPIGGGSDQIMREIIAKELAL